MTEKKGLACAVVRAYQAPPCVSETNKMAMKKSSKRKKKVTRRPWSKEDNRILKAHSKARTPVLKIARAMKRSEAALRQQAFKLGVGLGHRR
jgi:hypothetical protein